MKTPTRPIRVDLNEWAAFGEAAKAQDTDRSAAIRDFIAWYLHRPGAPKKLTRPDMSAWKTPDSEGTT